MLSHLLLAYKVSTQKYAHSFIGGRGSLYVIDYFHFSLATFKSFYLF